MKSIRRHKKCLATLLALLQFVTVFTPLQSVALTGGPSVPEVQQFCAVENTELVNLFTGDFNYQIPLLDIGGYPLTLSYSSNVGMESEASMVGLGWNINVGAISRDVRGLPDDLCGDAVQVTKSAKPKETTEYGAGLDVEITGFSATSAARSSEGEREGVTGKIGLSTALKLEHSSYEGWSANFSSGLKLKGSNSGGFKTSGSLGVGLSGSSSDGATLNASASIGFEKEIDDDEGIEGGLNYGLATNSRSGIKKNSFGAEIGIKNKGLFGRRGTFQVNEVGVKNGTFTGGGNFSIGYSSPSMNPTITTPMYQDGFGGKIKVGGEVGGVVTINGELEFSYSNLRYAKNFEQLPAYGFMYAHKSSNGRELMDVQREKGGSFSKEIPNLPVAQFAHDLYNVNVQGIQTSFRPFRGDAGTLYDPAANSMSCQGELGADIGAGDLLKIGVNIKVPVKYGQSGKWTDGNQFNTLNFKETVSDNPLYESVYFKSMGEAVAMANNELFNRIGNFDPVSAIVDEHGNTNAQLVKPDRTLAGSATENYIRQNREYRQNNFQWLTALEAAQFGFSKQIVSYPLNSFQSASNLVNYQNNISKTSRVKYATSGKHISEITITRTDGTRFVFGVPAYNNHITDVSFNISGAEKDSASGLVTYTPRIDNSPANSRGTNHKYEKERVPAHPYAWLLTDMLSADYVDLTGNGPSPDDLGTYTKFNYTQTNDQYFWRIPVEKNKAIFKEGSKTDDDDNMASYTYGSKELWYIHSIETKNYIAEFTYSDRDDAVGVQGEDGGLSAYPQQRMKKLDKIELYTRASRLEDNPVPIKTVHFVYDYSLCSKVPNNINGGGKLTLKRLWFQYGNSEKGSRNPYLFSYSSFNPDYHRKKIDRWGNYIDSEGGEDESKSYAALSKEDADRFASAWLLTRITTPTGSVINIEYESNDYAYVQHKKAMEFRPVAGFTDAENKMEVRTGESARNMLYDASNKVFNYVQFKLKQPVTSHEEVRPYVQDVTELYFSMNVRLSRPSENGYEKIEGFIPVNLRTAGVDFGMCTGGRYGWIRLPQMNDGNEMNDMNTPANDMTYNNGVHPVSKAAWETIRDEYMHLVYNQPADNHSPEAVKLALENCFAALGEMFEQANRYLRRGGHANKIKLKGAKIRLQSPDLVKFGGGARVKKITVSDEWGNMIQDPELNFSYGKEYQYTTEEVINGITRTISSGVAQYEPYSGNEENPFVEPYRYVEEKPLSINNNLFQTGPVGQIYYPAPVIGYSRVMIKDLQPAGAPATGFARHEFYTAKDFPTIVSTTPLHVRTRDIQVPPFYSEEHLNATQGFCIELNDMHGKQKAIYSYPPNSNNPVSGKLYKYKTDASNPSRLDNRVQTVNPSTGTIIEELVGVDYEFFADARENQQHNMEPEAELNMDISLRGPVPVIIPTVYPGYTHMFGRLRMATFNKIIYRCGLLEEVVAFDNGAQISTRNLLRDRESGEVVLQDVTNEFGDRHYQLTYPARWLTENSGMNGAYRNTGMLLNQQTVSSGTITLTNANRYFRQGDEVVCISRDATIPRSSDETQYGSTDTFSIAWVMNVDENRYVRLINRAGQPMRNGVYDILVLRSSYRNIINASAGKFTLTASPISGNQLSLPVNNVLNAEAIEYSNHWQTYGLFESAPPLYQCSCSHNQIVKRNAVDLLGQLVNKLLTTGDYKRRNINLTTTYSPGSALFAGRFSTEAIVYNGQLSGSTSRGTVTGYNSTRPEEQCELNIRMMDGTTFFPDTILEFTIDNRNFDDGDGDCNDIYTATGTITYLGAATAPQNITSGSFRPRITARVSITTCVPMANCQTLPAGRGEIRCLGTGRTTVNPFVTGILNNWRPFKNYVFVSTLNNDGHLRTSGTINNFTNFFTNTFPLSKASGIASSNWKEASMLTVCDNFGRAVETKDAIGNYSASLYGYGFSLQTAVATNAQHGEIAFDGFEDYNFRNQPNNPFNNCPLPAHFKPTEFEACDATVSHTGMYSLVVNSGTSVSRKYMPHYDFPAVPTSLATYSANHSVLISPFSPTPGKDFFLSVWVKKSAPENTSGANNILQQLSRTLLPLPIPGITPAGTGITPSATQGDVIVTARNSAGATTTIGNFKAEGTPIDGWYQVNGKFRVPPDAVSINVEMRAVNGKTWFDDLRIQPFNSVMKAYVYHPTTLHLMAVLDENNYATYYVYDQQEQLVATKKETEEGIFTVQESRNGTSKISRP